MLQDDSNGWLKIKNKPYSQAEGRRELLARIAAPPGEPPWPFPRLLFGDARQIFVDSHQGNRLSAASRKSFFEGIVKGFHFSCRQYCPVRT